MSKDKTNGNGCGKKHLTLLGMILVSVILLLLAGWGAMSSAQSTAMGGYDRRIRMGEQTDAATAERLEAIQRQLDRIERYVAP